MNDTVTPGKAARWTGYVLSGLTLLGLVMSALMKLTGSPQAVDGFAQQGWQASHLMPIGVVELACALLYAIPRTSVLGAILCTGYLGGAVVVHLRFAAPGLWIPIFIGVLAWGGLFLRDPRIRALIPLKRG
jgi:hypothetical protein